MKNNKINTNRNGKHRLLLFLLFIAFHTNTFATIADIDGLRYELDEENKTAEVLRCVAGREYSGALNIPANVSFNGKTYEVRSISFYAFERYFYITSVTLPSSIKVISDGAFYGCNGITSISLGNSIQKIGNSAFSGCSKITEIKIPKSVSLIDGNPFSYCSNLKSIIVEKGNTKYDSRNDCNAIIDSENDYLITGCINTIIPDNITTIGKYSFAGCKGLLNIDIPLSVFFIGDGAFCDCSGLTSIYIPKNLVSVGSRSFSGCSDLTSIVVASDNNEYDSHNDCNAIIDTDKKTLIAGCLNTVIPNDVLSISNYAFENCTKLKKIVIPNGVQTIGNSTFSGCKNLTSITIPSSVSQIKGSAFYGCDALSSIKIDANNTVYDSRENCNAIIETKSDALIQGCKNTVIPLSTKSIGNMAFGGINSLTKIIIPNNITKLGNSFDNCPNLTTVKIDIETPLQINKSTFSNRANATLYVPKGCIPAYSEAEYWKEFMDIQEISSYMIGDVNNDGYITVADYIAIVHYIMGNPPANFNVMAADTNSDGKINVADFTAITHLILYGTLEKLNE
ncbi:MAG: leucine-rich repeat protein [Prevotella sp.]|nr:leucine-rich repeat protein [Prevotella sp.]